MKKQMMSLMVGVSLFASTHVLAMDKENEKDESDKKNTILKIGEKEYKRDENKNVLNIIFEGFNIKGGRGNFVNIGKDPIQLILFYCGIKAQLNVSETSKSFYMLCSNVNVDEMNMAYDNSQLFAQNIPYTITIEQLVNFANKPNFIFGINKPEESSINICDDNSGGRQICEFSLGKKCFTLTNGGHQKDYMECLPKDTKIKFVWELQFARDDNHAFYADFTIIYKDGTCSLVTKEQVWNKEWFEENSQNILTQNTFIINRIEKNNEEKK